MSSAGSASTTRLGDPPLDENGDRGQRLDPGVKVLLGEGQILSDLGIPETAPELLESQTRGDDLEGAIPQKAVEDLAGRPCRTNQGADEDVGVEDGAQTARL